VTAVLVTGASGFIGRAACAQLERHGTRVVRGTRENGSLERGWPLQGMDAVVHLAGVAHELHGQNAESVYQALNCEASERLAREAARAGVGRFVFMSSVKVNGERTPVDRPFRAADAPDPQDRYARSKWAAEQALARVAKETGLEVVVLRPPLVYGPGVRANFLRLVRLVERRLPLPFGAIANRRSMVYVDNLVDLIELALERREASGHTFFVSDGDDLSTPRLAMELGRALGREPTLVPVPVPLLRLAGVLTGMRAELGRLVDSLRVDVGDTRERLGWTPSVSPSEGIARTVAWYRSAAR
jgi:nucleoside-diphosphate-sugar epimerase